MLFKNTSEFGAWLQEYSGDIVLRKPHTYVLCSTQKFLDAMKSQNYTVSEDNRFDFKEDIVYIFKRHAVISDSEWFFIYYHNGDGSRWYVRFSTQDSPTKMIRRMIVNMDWNSWVGMKGAKIWILSDDSNYKDLLNWQYDPFEVKS